MERHVALLGILTRLWGGLAMLVGVSLLLIAAGALALTIEPGAGSVGLAAGITVGMFAVLGGFAVLWGGVHLWAGTLIGRRNPLGRIVSLALAVVNLLVIPFGTALGAYALWVLLKDDGRRLFEPPVGAGPPRGAAIE